MRAILLILTVSSAFAAEWSKSWHTGTNPEIYIRCGDANVDLRSGASGQVDARLTTKGWEIRSGEVEVIEHQSGDRVDIEVRVPRFRTTLWHGNRSMRLEMVVPSQARIRVNTGDGNVTGSRVGGELQFETGDGNIIADGLAGKVSAHTGDGNVRLEGRFDGLTVNTGDGNVDITAQRGSTNSETWRIQTGDGNVRLHVPGDLRANLDASTGDGRITSDLPLSVGPGKIGGHQLHRKLNGGGSLFSVRTNDGNIHFGVSR